MNKNDMLPMKHDTGYSGLVHWDDPEGWDGREVGEGFRTH